MVWNPKAQLQFANDLVTASLVLDEGSDTREAIQAVADQLITLAVAADPTLAANVTAAAEAAVDSRADQLGLVRTAEDTAPAESYFRGSDVTKRSWLGFRRRDGGIASRTVWAIVNAVHIYVGYDEPFVYPGNFVLWVDFNESDPSAMFKRVEA